MTTAAEPDFQDHSPPEPPGVVTGGPKPGSGGRFMPPTIDWDLFPFLASVGLDHAEQKATVMACTWASLEGDSILLEWDQKKCAKRAAVSVDTVKSAKKKLQAAGLIVLKVRPRKGKNPGIWDITDLIDAKGTAHV